MNNYIKNLLISVGVATLLMACNSGSNSNTASTTTTGTTTTLTSSSDPAKSYSYSFVNDNGRTLMNFQFNGFAGESVESIVINSTVVLSAYGSINCFNIDNRYYKESDLVESDHYANILSNPNPIFKIAASAPGNTCGPYQYSQGPESFSFVMPTIEAAFPVINPQILDVTVYYPDGSSVVLAEKSAPVEQDPGYGKQLMGYFANWAKWNGQNYGPESIPVNRLNAIDYAFIYFDTTDGHVYGGDPEYDPDDLPVVAAQVHEHGSYLKAYLAFGGWTNYVDNVAQPTDQRFTQMTSNPDGTPNTANIKNFATTAVYAMKKLGFSGIDIDWEWWNSTTDTDYDKDYATRMLALYQGVRDELDAQAQVDGFTDAHHYKLLMALPINQNDINAQENAYPGYWETLYQIGDYFDVMSYDMHGDWDYTSDHSTLSYFQAAFYDVNDPYPESGSSFSILKGLDAYKQYVPDTTKFVLGVPAYGRAMQVGNSQSTIANAGLLQPIISGTNLSQRPAQGSSSWDYSCIVENSTCNPNPKLGVQNVLNHTTLVNQQNHSQYTSLWSTYNGGNSDGTDGAMQPWAYAQAVVSGIPSAWIFLSYDDVDSVAQKTNYALSQNFAGTFMWELDGDTDDANKSLLQSMSNTFKDASGN